MRKRFLASISSVAFVLFSWTTVSAQEPFYKGKTIRIVAAASAGGGFDAYTRTIGRYMGKHIPGQPAIVVENMPGAGHLIGANHVYKLAKPDGLTIGHFQGGLFLYQLFGRPGIEFDAMKFEYLGAPVVDNRACAFTKASGITSMEKWMACKSSLQAGPGTSSSLSLILPFQQNSYTSENSLLCKDEHPPRGGVVFPIPTDIHCVASKAF